MTTPYVPGPAPAPQQPFTLQQMAKQPRRTRRWLVWLLVAVAVLGISGAAAGWYLTQSSDAPTGRDPGAALVAACQDEAKKKLKSPATARFSEERPVELGDRFHYIDGVVDAQNGFGAMVRSKYRCKAESTDAGWSVIRVEFSDWP